MVEVAETPLQYELVRSRRTTADIVLERDGRIVVRVPHHLADDAVSRIVESKRFWIYKNLAEWRELNASRVLRQLRNGEGIPYFGRNYRLSLVDEQAQGVALVSGRICLRRDLIGNDSSERVTDAFRDFYAAAGLRRISQRVRYFAPKVGVKPGKVAIRDLAFRWGSCSPKGVLAFHWKCAMAPLTIIDYIVVHELCHMHHLNHTDAFWNEVDKVLPDYRERKAWLSKHGAMFDLFEQLTSQA